MATHLMIEMIRDPILITYLNPPLYLHKLRMKGWISRKRLCLLSKMTIDRELQEAQNCLYNVGVAGTLEKCMKLNNDIKTKTTETRSASLVLQDSLIFFRVFGLKF